MKLNDSPRFARCLVASDRRDSVRSEESEKVSLERKIGKRRDGMMHKSYFKVRERSNNAAWRVVEMTVFFGDG